MLRPFLTSMLFMAAIATPLGAQLESASDRFGGSCASASSGVRGHCFRVAEAVQIMEPRAAIVLTGGNPVPGTASTLGMRIGTLPRMSIAARVSAARVALPGIQRATNTDELSFTPIAVGLDASVGLFNGLTLASTVGGFASVDLLASIGRLQLSTDDDFAGSLTSWSGGARVGILRESFTAPGVSVSAMYRRLGDLTYGDAELASTDGWFRLEDMSGWSVRAAASKRVLGFGLTAGAGHDWYSADASARVRDAGTTITLQEDELESSRTTFFGNAAFTLMILHTVAELGWQSGGSSDPVITTTGRLEKAGLYGSLAIRLSL